MKTLKNSVAVFIIIISFARAAIAGATPARGGALQINLAPPIISSGIGIPETAVTYSSILLAKESVNFNGRRVKLDFSLKNANVEIALYLTSDSGQWQIDGFTPNFSLIKHENWEFKATDWYGDPAAAALAQTGQIIDIVGPKLGDCVVVDAFSFILPQNGSYRLEVKASLDGQNITAISCFTVQH